MIITAFLALLLNFQCETAEFDRFGTKMDISGIITVYF